MMRDTADFYFFLEASKCRIFNVFYSMNHYGLARYFYFFYLCNRKAVFDIRKASFHCAYLYCSGKSKY